MLDAGAAGRGDQKFRTGGGFDVVSPRRRARPWSGALLRRHSTSLESTDVSTVTRACVEAMGGAARASEDGFDRGVERSR